MEFLPFPFFLFFFLFLAWGGAIVHWPNGINEAYILCYPAQGIPQKIQSSHQPCSETMTEALLGGSWSYENVCHFGQENNIQLHGLSYLKLIQKCVSWSINIET